MCHSLFMNSHQLAPCVAVFGISTEKEESPFSPLPGGDLHSREIQGLAALAEHVHNAAGENGKCCTASVESCYTHSTDNCKKKGRGQESTRGTEAYRVVSRLANITFVVKKGTALTAWPPQRIPQMRHLLGSFACLPWKRQFWWILSTSAFEKGSVKMQVALRWVLEPATPQDSDFSKGCVLSLHFCVGEEAVSHRGHLGTSRCRGTGTGTAAVAGMTYTFRFSGQKSNLKQN